MQQKIVQSAKSYENLLCLEYQITLGKKGETSHLLLRFDKSDFFHLAGLHYLKDKPQLRGNSEKIYELLLAGKISASEVSSSIHFNEIKNRIALAGNIPAFFNGNPTVFKYNSTKNPYSNIDADYLVKIPADLGTAYLFLSKEQKSDRYFCRSTFYEKNLDFSRNQIRMSVLKIQIRHLQHVHSSSRLST